MTHATRTFAALALAVAAHAAGASQIQGTGIGATNHETVAGTTSRPVSTSKPTAATKAAKPASPAASGARK